MFFAVQFFTLATESLLQQILVLLITVSLITENSRSSSAIVLMQRSAWVAFPAYEHNQCLDVNMIFWVCEDSC